MDEGWLSSVNMFTEKERDFHVWYLLVRPWAIVASTLNCNKFSSLQQWRRENKDHQGTSLMEYWLDGVANKTRLYRVNLQPLNILPWVMMHGKWRCFEQSSVSISLIESLNVSSNKNVFIFISSWGIFLLFLNWKVIILVGGLTVATEQQETLLFASSTQFRIDWWVALVASLMHVGGKTTTTTKKRCHHLR